MKDKIKLIDKEVLLMLIDNRRKSVQQELNSAISNKEWSKVPGFDGIDIGLMIAEKYINEM